MQLCKSFFTIVLNLAKNLLAKKQNKETKAQRKLERIDTFHAQPFLFKEQPKTIFVKKNLSFFFYLSDSQAITISQLVDELVVERLGCRL
jgi:hypothetical protein